MMEMRFVALEKWPQEPTKNRRRSQFSAKWASTIDVLERELGFLRARDVVIQADCDRDQVRIDGMLRAGAKMRGPGVVLSFESKHGPLSYPCDTFTDWQDNVRAIALALEALRSVDRYGVTKSAEQYQGWARLPDRSNDGPFPDADAALNWLQESLVLPIPHAPRDDAEKSVLRREAMRAFHPDRCGGDAASWKLWTAAAAVLGIEV